jgi:enoyl-CoA hydratase/carnithine racemase
MTDMLLRRDSDNVATLTLNRPEARNALSMRLMQALDAALVAIGDDPDIRAVIIGANGPAFCAGHDLREIRANPTRADYEAVFALCSCLMQRIVRLPKPVIARVHGVATAAGCQLVASADLAVAADTARFATPGVNIGDLISAERAREIGLINRVVPADVLDDTAHALARQIAAKSPLTVAIGKEAFYRQAEMDLSDAYDYAAQVMTRNMLARDAVEGIDAFLGKREPSWTGT